MFENELMWACVPEPSAQKCIKVYKVGNENAALFWKTTGAGSSKTSRLPQIQNLLEPCRAHCHSPPERRPNWILCLAAYSLEVGTATLLRQTRRTLRRLCRHFKANPCGS